MSVHRGYNPHPAVPASKDAPSLDVSQILGSCCPSPTCDPYTGCHIQLYLCFPEMLPYPDLLPTSSMAPSRTGVCPIHLWPILRSVTNIHLWSPPAQMHRPAQLWPPPPIYSYHPPPDMRPRPRHGPSSLDGLHQHRCSPTSSCASLIIKPLPTGSSLRNPSQPRLPWHLPSRLSHPAVPLPSPRCAPFPPLPTHLPAPERRPHPTMPRAEARPGPCSRDAPRGLPPLFPPCVAQRLPPNLPFPAGRSADPQPHPLIQSNRRLGAVSQSALREGSPHFTPFPGSLASGRLQLPASSARRRR